MRTYWQTIEDLDAAVGPSVDPRLRQVARDDIDLSDDMDGVETFLVEAAERGLRLPADLLDDVERVLLPTATRPPQGRVVAGAVARLRELAQMTV